MTVQPIPELSDEDIDRIIERDFAEADRDEVSELLSRFESEEQNRGTVRIRIALLKLVNGNLKKLREQITTGKCDYRDLMASAEYPRYMDHYHSGMSEVDEQKIIESDWKQYQEWLKK